MPVICEARDQHGAASRTASCELFVDAKILPAGALSARRPARRAICSTHLGGRDVVAFTGSAATPARRCGRTRNIAGSSVRLNVEADSLNAAVLAPDVDAGSRDVRACSSHDVVRDMTQKTGPEVHRHPPRAPCALLDQVRDELVERLRDAKVGDPAPDGDGGGPARDGAAAPRRARASSSSGAESKVVLGGLGAVREGRRARGQGLLRAADAAHQRRARDCAGRCTSTRSSARRRRCSPTTATRRRSPTCRRAPAAWCRSVYTDDRDFVGEVVMGIAPFHGRLVLGSEKIADQTPGPGTVLPQSIHGGPGRAGGGEELGGLRGLSLLLAAHRHPGRAADAGRPARREARRLIHRGSAPRRRATPSLDGARGEAAFDDPCPLRVPGQHLPLTDGRSGLPRACVQGLVTIASRSTRPARDRGDVGNPPHAGTRDVLARNGIACDHHARVLVRADLDRFDHVVAMNRRNLRDIEALGRGRAVVSLFLDHAAALGVREVPDPYYTGNFEEVLVRSAVRRAAAKLRAEIAR